MNTQKKLIKVVIYIMIASMALSTILFTAGIFIK
ncbi:MAG: stressosome-associated protein Prli42 [Paenibacillaceae bacterium]